MNSKPTILLVDDHQIVLDGLKNIIKELNQYQIIGTANNGNEALQYIQTLEPDIVLLDIDMPIMNGIVVAERSKKEHPETKIIILSLHHEKSIIKHLISTGVDGYLLKNSDKSELLKALEIVAQGKKYFSSDVAISLSQSQRPFHSLRGELDQTEILLSLTNREKEIVSLICEGLTNKELAERLHISPRTADAHRANLMKKLNVKNVVGVVKFAMKHGLT